MAWLGIVVFVLFVGFKILEGILSGLSSVASKITGPDRRLLTKSSGGEVEEVATALSEKSEAVAAAFEAKLPEKWRASKNSHISYRSYRSNYWFDDFVKDCLNEIAKATGVSGGPGHGYLRNWRWSASSDWQTLTTMVEARFKACILELEAEERDRAEEVREKEREECRKKAAIEETRHKLIAAAALAKGRVNGVRQCERAFEEVFKVSQRQPKGVFLADHLQEVLESESYPWLSGAERTLRGFSGSPMEVVLDKTQSGKLFETQAEELKSAAEDYNKALASHASAKKKAASRFKKIKESYKAGEKEGVVFWLEHTLENLDFPASVPKRWSVDWNSEERIAVVEPALPDVVHGQFAKEVQLKSGPTLKPLSQTEKRELVPKIQPAVLLRIAREIFDADAEKKIDLLVLNGWVEYDDPKTGNLTRAYTASIALQREQIVGLNLKKLEPLSAFNHLKGKSAGSLIDIVPVAPIVSLNKEDRRFISTKDVLSQLGTETNLATMDWKDFESLIAQLFERVFAADGAEVKVTQASRDRGVDAVVFNPDPIKGGKIIIQAKRYANTVDVSAVRDLCAVVKKEGATKGILVTTSTFGADAYAFAQGEPVTLLNGAELLGLLASNGYKFRINLAEAKELNAANNRPPADKK